MIFWIALLVFGVCIVITIGVCGGSSRFENAAWDFVSIFVTPITGIIVAVMITFIAINNIGAEAELEANKQRYEALVYQAENDVYENDNDIGKKELFNQIQDWNEDLAINKKLQKNFWVGIFYADIYDQFELIPMSIFEGEDQNEVAKNDNTQVN